ncbi:MAG: hypothetical protein NTV45_05425 [Firmicutes bacterium]|nr:hypothetical protein [Bacillota bacterium]
MMTLQITEQEVPLLQEILNKYLVDLRREISRTEKKGFLADLEAEEALMTNLLRQLSEPTK